MIGYRIFASDGNHLSDTYTGVFGFGRVLVCSCRLFVASIQHTRIDSHRDGFIKLFGPRLEFSRVHQFRPRNDCICSPASGRRRQEKRGRRTCRRRRSRLVCFFVVVFSSSSRHRRRCLCLSVRFGSIGFCLFGGGILFGG